MLSKKTFVIVILLTSFLKPFAQVTLQTGSAVFSVPMFDWKDDKSRLTSTVAISYSSGSGLKVNDVASNVGQGWNLIAGGVISRMQVGEPDDQPAYTGAYPNKGDQDLTRYPAGYLYNTTSPPAAGCPASLIKYPTYGGMNVLYTPKNATTQDLQLDYFSFQFNGKSGMFVIDTTGGWHGVPLGDTKLKIDLQVDNTMAASQGIRTTITAFTVTDVDGLIYKFTNHGLTRLLSVNFCHPDGAKPIQQPTFGNNGVYCQTAFDQGPTGPGPSGLAWYNSTMANPYVISNWYLSEVDDPFTSRKITFTYNTLNLSNSAGTDLTFNKSSDNYVVVNFKRSMTTVQEIASISYPDGHLVNFAYAGTSRFDYTGEKALAKVSIFYNSRNVSQYQLNTTYFILNRYGTPSTDYEKSVSRLCLKSVKKFGVDVLEDSPPYIFDYYLGSNNADDFVPPPFFYAKDIWGYYNGSNSIPSNCPLTGCSTPIPLNVTNPYNLGFYALKGLCFQNDNVSGIYYNAKSNYAQNGLLKEIIYPTGGSLTYSYAQNNGVFMDAPGTSRYVGGVNVSQTSSADGGYSNGCANPVVTQYSYVINSTGSSSLWGLETPVNSIVNTNYWAEEHQTIHFSLSHPFGECLWHYIYPGIQSRYESISLSTLQNIMVAISPVLGAISVVSTICDVVSICAEFSFWTVAAIILDVISAVLDYIVSCPQQTKNTMTTVFYNFDLNALAPLPAQFRRVEVTESPGTIGKTVQEFTHGDPSATGGADYPLWFAAGTNTALSAKQRFAPWAYGLPKLTTYYDASGNKIKETQNVYDFSNAKIMLQDPGHAPQSQSIIAPRSVLPPPVGYPAIPLASCKCQVNNSRSQRSDGWSNDPITYQAANNADMTVDIYDMYTGHAQLANTLQRTYRTTDATQFVQTETDYSYNNDIICAGCPNTPGNFDLNQVVTIQSNGDKNYKLIRYPSDYNNGILATLVQKNILSLPVCTESYVVKAGTSANEYLGEKVTEFSTIANGDIRPYRVIEQRFAKPVTSLTAYSGPATTNYSSYKIPQTFTYDANSNLVGVRDEGNRVVTNIYDYNDKYVVATVINADPVLDKPAFTSFESLDLSRSGWTLIGPAAYNQNATSETGNNNFTILANVGNYLNADSLNTATAYILSFWATSGTLTVNSGATLKKTGPAYHGFTYYEYSIPGGAASVAVSNNTATNVNIDELRLYPANARMTTFTYDPLIGKTSECDANNRITFYNYDNLGRMTIVEDDTRNIVKYYEYNNVSAQKQQGCPATYSSRLLTETVSRSNCQAGYQGSGVTYTMPAGQFTSTLSQQDADFKAEIYFLTNSQNYANTNGSCALIYYNAVQSKTVTTQSCLPGQVGGNVTYTVPARTYSSIISQQDADQQALNDIAGNAQAYANNPDHAACSIDMTPDWEWFPGDGVTGPDPSYCATVNGQLPAHLFVLATDVNPNSPTFNQTKYEDYGPNNACPANTYYNAAASASFTRNNCGIGNSGSAVTYTVPTGKYSSTTSQAAADQQAQNDINANGQNYANANGTCQVTQITINYSNERSFSYTISFTTVLGGTTTQIQVDPQSDGSTTLPVGTYNIQICPVGNNIPTHNYSIGTQSIEEVVCGTFSSYSLTMTTQISIY